MSALEEIQQISKRFYKEEGTLIFPRDWDFSDFHIGDYSQAIEKFRASAKKLGRRALARLFISDRFFFVFNSSIDKTFIKQASFHALASKYRNVQEIIETDKLDFGPMDVQYFRVDYHPLKMSSIFSEPPIHIHSLPKDAPRFSFNRAMKTGIVIGFLEFLYRNYESDKYSSMIDLVWEKYTTSKKVSNGEGILLELKASWRKGNFHDLVNNLSHIQSFQKFYLQELKQNFSYKIKDESEMVKIFDVLN
jgi:hypothetical protein